MNIATSLWQKFYRKEVFRLQYKNKVEICGINTSKLTVLSEDKKTELIKKAHDGDAAARDEMIRGNLKLVLSVIQRFSNRGEPLDDLFQVGCMGLIKAIDNFNTELSVRFSTYAVPMICTLGKKKGTTLQNGRKPSNIKAFGVFYSTSTKRC